MWFCLLVFFPQISVAKLQPPVSFEQTRRVLFRYADLDEDGLLSYDRRVPLESGEAPSEWEALFRVVPDLQSVYNEPQRLRDAKVPKNVRKALKRGVLDFHSFVNLSQHALQQIVKDNGKHEQPTGEQAWRHAEALLAMHLWDKAEAAILKTLQVGGLQPDTVRSHVGQLHIKGRHLEASWLLNCLHRIGLKGPNLGQAADALSSVLPRTTDARPLRPAPEAFAKSQYLEQLRVAPAAACPDTSATRDAVMEAIRGSRPVRMQGANLVPGIHHWAEALQKNRDGVALFDIDPSGVFDHANSSGSYIAPAKQPIKFGDIEAIAKLEGARFYFEVGDDMDELARFVDTIPVPSIVEDLNLSKRHMWASVGGGTVSPIHWDDYENIISQVHGTKEILLWPPQDYVHFGYENKQRYEWQFDCCPAQLGQRMAHGIKQNNVATVLISEWEKHPQLQQTSPLLCQLNPGDALVVPLFWHHMVVSHPGEAQSCDLCGALSNLAMNFWFVAHRQKFLQQAQMCTAVVEPGQCKKEYVRAKCQLTCAALVQKSQKASNRDEI